ncbi:MICOS complex subunit mic25a-like isoform X3 [Sinocyclocheilus anshuiensis]|uniref:MICOS complex subunit mic25a-like isoform X3 n=1 Tax=Sinocyclocheilus anshuiensis TaxID=1608454 RepID=UPI0007B9DDD0|nr:PREDICTED: MICOS complex subunit mic25a-like isoform X3 [Sinocyclocheilus anshuiensis]
MFQDTAPYKLPLPNDPLTELYQKAMGSGESTTRRVSFGLDEDDRVRILRGVKLSEDVLQRMRNASADPRPPVNNKENLGQQTRTSSTSDPQSPKTQARTTFPDTKEELRKRYEQQQAIIQEELARIARKEREAARHDMTRAVQRERVQTRQESEKAKQLNEERFKMSAEQFHTAATRSEANIKPRNVEPVCSNLQTQILNCYRQNREQTLQCSDLAKEYMQCISAAKKKMPNRTGY